MDEFGHPFDAAGEHISPFTIVTWLLTFALCLTTCLLSFSEMSMIGPDVGEIVTFRAGAGVKHWEQPGIPARLASGPATRGDCTLMPSVISASGGSFVIEAKETSRPPVFRLHWSGARTDSGAGDCGGSADLLLPLAQLRALANVAGGFGVEHGFFFR
jgi:hypothetical protein